MEDTLADNSDHLDEVKYRRGRRSHGLRKACGFILSFLLCVKDPNKRSRHHFRKVTPLAPSTAPTTLHSRKKNFDGFNGNNNGTFYNGFNDNGMENSIDGDFGYDPATNNNGSNGYGMDDGKDGSPGSWEQCKARTSGLGETATAKSGKSGYFMTVKVEVHPPPAEIIPEESAEAVDCDSASPNVNARTELQRIEDLETKLFIMDEANKKMAEELAELKEDTLEMIGEISKLYITDAERTKTFQIILKNCKYLGAVSIKQMKNSRKIISDVLEIFESEKVQQAEFQVGVTSALQMLDDKVRQLFNQFVILKDFATDTYRNLTTLITSIGNYFAFGNQRNSRRN